MNRKHLIFGTGPLGLWTMDKLIARGYTTITLANRSGATAEPLPDGVRVVSTDLYDAAKVRLLAEQADVIFFTAQPEYTEWPEQFPPLVQGLIDGIRGLDVRLVFGDNLYMYGSTNGAPIHEDLPHKPHGHKGKTRARLAEMLLAAHEAGDIRVAIGRGSDFYGPRVRSSTLGDVFFGAVVAGKSADLIGNLDLPHTYTYIEDFANALVTLSEQDDAFGRAWHIPNDTTLTTRRFIALVEAAHGEPIKVRTANRWMVRALGLFNPILREYNEMYYEFAEPHIVDDAQYREAFGSGVVGNQEAIARTLTWWKNVQNR